MARAKRPSGPWVCFDRRQDAAPSPRASTHASFHTVTRPPTLSSWAGGKTATSARGVRRTEETYALNRRHVTGVGRPGRQGGDGAAGDARHMGGRGRTRSRCRRCDAIRSLGSLYVLYVYSTVLCPTTDTFLISLLRSACRLGKKKTCSQGRSLSCPPATQCLS
jgi:hypothetical protein